jgi:hypothetical protein
MSKIRTRNVACGCVNSRIFFSECGSLPTTRKGPRRLLRRGLAAPCSGRGNRPPKAVSEPPAGAKCKHQKSHPPSNVQASNHLRISVSSWFRPRNQNLPFRGQLCSKKWQEDSVTFSLQLWMSAVTSYYLVRHCSYFPQLNADQN